MFLSFSLVLGCEEQMRNDANQEFQELLARSDYDAAFKMVSENQYLGENHRRQVTLAVFERRLELVSSNGGIQLEEAKAYSLELEKAIQAELVNHHDLIKKKFETLIGGGETVRAEKLLTYFQETLRVEDQQEMAQKLYNILMGQGEYARAAAIAKSYKLTVEQTAKAAEEGFEKITDPAKRLDVARTFGLSRERQVKAAASFCSYVEEQPRLTLPIGRQYLEMALEYDVAKETRAAMAGWVIILMLEEGAIQDAIKLSRSFDVNYLEFKPVILKYGNNISPFHFLQYESSMLQGEPERQR